MARHRALRARAGGRRGPTNLDGVARLLVVVPIETDPPARLGRLAAATPGSSSTSGTSAPATRCPTTSTGYDGLVVLGGPQSALDDDGDQPRARRRPRSCCGRRWPPTSRPSAICLGAQLLAQVGGGRVRVGHRRPGGRRAARRQARRRRQRPASSARCRSRPTCIQFHHDEISELPTGRDAAGQQPDVREPGVPGRPARLRAAVPHRDDAGDRPRVGRAATPSASPPARTTAETICLPAPTRRTPTSRRSGRRSPAGSPTWSGPAPARPPERPAPP